VPEVPPGVLRADTGEQPFRLARAPAGAGLEGVVDHLWAVSWSLPRGTDHVQEVVTLPCVHLAVEPDGPWVHGVVTRRFSRRITGRGRAVGAAFRPGGFSALTSSDLSQLTDRMVPAGEVLGDVSGLRAVEHAAEVPDAFAALATWLTGRAPPPDDEARTVSEAVDLVAGDRDIARVDQLAGALGVSARTLQRRFARHLGVGPKWVVQRARIHDALERIDDGEQIDWADLATRLGFSDQAHFVNSFTAVVGVAPARYERRPSAG
jgi:AraC-like DNA-binding protein